MKILVISQYYPPEPGAPSNRIQAFVTAMSKRGHEVTVICEFPNYPTGRLSPADKWRFFRIDEQDSLKVIRTFVLAFPKKNNIKRMFFYLSFALSSFIAALLLRRRDVILASSPPIFHVYLAMIVARIKKSIFVLDVRDIWPDTALEFKAVTNDKLLKWGGLIERHLYRAADMIFAISRGMKAMIAARGGEDKISVVYNGSAEDMLEWSGDRQSIRRSMGWERKIVVAYAGLIGLGQNLVALLPEIAGRPGEDIVYVLIGDGPGKEQLRREIARLKIENVVIMDLMPRAEVIAYSYAADIMLVILRESDFFKSAIPSKFFDSMATGKPVVSNVDGELRELLEQNKTGLYFSLRDNGSLTRAIETLAGDPPMRDRMGENGRRLIIDRFLRSKIADKAIEDIENLEDQRSFPGSG